jgi:nucleoid DNA-binding protein
VPTITKKELTGRIAEKMGRTQSTLKTIIQRFLDEIISGLGKGNRLEFREFGLTVYVSSFFVPNR